MSIVSGNVAGWWMLDLAPCRHIIADWYLPVWKLSFTTMENTWKMFDLQLSYLHPFYCLYAWNVLLSCSHYIVAVSYCYHNRATHMPKDVRVCYCMHVYKVSLQSFWTNFINIQCNVLILRDHVILYSKSSTTSLFGQTLFRSVTVCQS